MAKTTKKVHFYGFRSLYSLGVRRPAGHYCNRLIAKDKKKGKEKGGGSSAGKWIFRVVHFPDFESELRKLPVYNAHAASI